MEELGPMGFVFELCHFAAWTFEMELKSWMLEKVIGLQGSDHHVGGWSKSRGIASVLWPCR